MNNQIYSVYFPIERHHDRTEEQIGQQFGYPVVFPTPWDRMTLRLGRIFLRIGEKLTHEDPCLELSGKTA